MKRLKVLVAAAVLASAVSAWADDQPRQANPGDRSSERPVSGERGGERPVSGDRGGDRPVAGERGGDAANPRGERSRRRSEPCAANVAVMPSICAASETPMLTLPAARGGLAMGDRHPPSISKISTRRLA